MKYIKKNGRFVRKIVSDKYEKTVEEIFYFQVEYISDFVLIKGWVVGQRYIF